MSILILTIILIYLIDTVLVGISFFSLRERFQWHISCRASLIVLFLISHFWKTTLLFGFGIFEIVVWVVQSILAALIGEMLIVRKPTSVA